MPLECNPKFTFQIHLSIVIEESSIQYKQMHLSIVKEESSIQYMGMEGHWGKLSSLGYVNYLHIPTQ